jgi:hypothetical protein
MVGVFDNTQYEILCSKTSQVMLQTSLTAYPGRGISAWGFGGCTSRRCSKPYCRGSLWDKAICSECRLPLCDKDHESCWAHHGSRWWQAQRSARTRQSRTEESPLFLIPKLWNFDNNRIERPTFYSFFLENSPKPYCLNLLSGSSRFIRWEFWERAHQTPASLYEYVNVLVRSTIWCMFFHQPHGCHGVVHLRWS